MRVIECGEDLSFFAEATQDEIRVHSAFDQFNGCAFVKFVVCAHSFVDSAHTAASDLSLDSIGAETASEHRVFLIDKRLEDALVGLSVNGLVEEIAGAVVL